MNRPRLKDASARSMTGNKAAGPHPSARIQSGMREKSDGAPMVTSPIRSSKSVA